MTKNKERFVDVVNYIEANLDTELDIETLCQVGGLSKYHFHRQCSVFFGMSVMSLIRLLRLKQAGYQLAFRDEPIITIALESGYDSHEAFSRAFKRHFHQTPSDFKKSPDWTHWHATYEPILNLRTTVMCDKTKVEIVEFPKTLIGVKEHRGEPTSIGESVQAFIAWRKANRLPPSVSRTFNLLYDDPTITAPEDYRLDLACAVNDKVEENNFGIVNKVIPSGKCALVRHQGSDDKLGALVSYLYGEWLENANYAVRDFPIFLERVTFFPDVPENEVLTHIYLPIE